MSIFKYSDSIEKLGLSNRSYNALSKQQITTVHQFITLTEQDLQFIPQLGKKSIDEILQLLTTIEVDTTPEPDKISIPKIDFFAKNGTLYKNTNLSTFPFSARTKNGLNKAGFRLLAELLTLSENEITAIPSLGNKSVSELQSFIENIVLELVPFELPEPDSPINAHNFSIYIIVELSKLVYIDTQSIYENIYPTVLAYLEETSSTLQMIHDDIEFFAKFFEDEELKEVIKAVIVASLQKQIYGLTFEQILHSLPEFLQNKNALSTLLQELIENQEIEVLPDNAYILAYPSILEYVNSLKTERDQQILRGRLRGQTLQQIGDMLEITRERIRQLEVKIISNRPNLREDIYGTFFEKYDISKEDFLYGFNETEETFEFLTISYKQGESALNSAFLDDTIPHYFKKAVEKIIYKKYITINGERVYCSRVEIFEYVLRNYAHDGLTFSQILEIYNNILHDLHLEENLEFKIVDHSYENRLSMSYHVLAKYGKRFRYYNINAYDYTTLFETLHFEQYLGLELSTKKFLVEYPELMQEYDIRDEYELHNLLKKICTPANYPYLNFKRMPNIEFGTASRDKQVEKLLMNLAPITNVDFATAYEEEYGVQAQTVLANYLKNFNHYFYNGVYRVDLPTPPDEKFAEFKSLLTDDFYTINEVQQIYLQHFPNNDLKYVNSTVLKLAGFLVYANYIVRTSYGNAVNYFRTLLTATDVVDTTFIPIEIRNIVAYTSELYKRKSAYDIIEYEPLKYVNLHVLQDQGIDIVDFHNYCQAVYYFAGNNYFTIHSLKAAGFTHYLDDLGLDNWFYSSLLTEDKEHFSYQRMGKNKLFSKDKKNILFADFIKFIVLQQEYQSCSPVFLEKLLKNNYDILVPPHKIIEIIKEVDLYYNPVEKTIYANYEVYTQQTNQ